MSKPALAFLVPLLLASIGSAATQSRRLLPSTVPSCRHTGAVSQEDRDRAGQAVALAKAINAAEADLIKRFGEYRPVAALNGLPTSPTGFRVNLYSDRTGYLFSLKDDLDPCHFAVISDGAGLIYQQSALTAPVVAK